MTADLDVLQDRLVEAARARDLPSTTAVLRELDVAAPGVAATWRAITATYLAACDLFAVEAGRPATVAERRALVDAVIGRFTAVGVLS